MCALSKRKNDVQSIGAIQTCI